MTRIDKHLAEYNITDVISQVLTVETTCSITNQG